MAKAARVCLIQGCPEIATAGSRCEEHRLAWRPGRGSTYQWRRLRERILRRDGYRCTYTDDNGRCRERDRLHVDHIIPVSLGGTDDPINLRVLCEYHNLSKGTDTRNG